ncbi:MAG TPA: hypothetical protein VN939_06005 [Chthoniobacterales bacterium]|jgi:hypothetical protein|nr:hypothetical protein [Chthoniobacterales bacterium]
MSTRLQQAKKQAQIDLGAALFFEKHRDLYPAEANVSVLAAQIMAKDLGPLDSVESWDKAYALVAHQLCERPQPRPEPSPEPEVWPHKFMREVRTYDDVKSYPQHEYKALWFDKGRGGALTEKAQIFRAIVQAILDKENSKRGSR